MPTPPIDNQYGDQILLRKKWPYTIPDEVGGARKRIFDIVFAATALITLFSVFVFISACILVLTRGPVFFVHRRIGINGNAFPCLKFRTMVPDAEQRLAKLLSDDPAAAEEFARFSKLRRDPRIIPGIGTFLRRTSLDELPQFLNVLVGHMSVVGPRPVTKKEFMQHYGPVHPIVRVRPGITGLWQVSGRNDVVFPHRADMDAEYVRGWSFAKDVKIIIQTISMVCLSRNGL